MATTGIAGWGTIFACGHLPNPGLANEGMVAQRKVSANCYSEKYHGHASQSKGLKQRTGK
jgi:hypothetical protein